MKSTIVLVVGCLVLCLLQSSQGKKFELSGECKSIGSNNRRVNKIRITSPDAPSFMEFVVGRADTNGETLFFHVDSPFGTSQSKEFKREAERSYDYIVGPNGIVAVFYSDEKKIVVFINQDSSKTISLKSGTSVGKIVRLAEYKGMVYFANENGVVYSANWTDLENSVNVNVDMVADMKSSVAGIENGVQHCFVSEKDGDKAMKTVDVACLYEGGGDSCVKSFDSDGRDHYKLISFGNVMMAQSKTTPSQYLAYDVSGKEAIAYDYLDFYGCCTADPLRAYIYCSQDKGNLFRFRFDNVSDVETIDNVKCENWMMYPPSDPEGCQLQIEYDLKNEKGLVCGGIQENAGCFNVIVSNCAGESDIAGDPVFCRLNLDTYQINKLVDCQDPKRCINELADINVESNTVEVHSGNLTLYVDKILSSQKLYCKYGDKTPNKVTELNCDEEGCNVTCVIPNELSGDTSVSLMYEEKNGKYKDLSKPVSIFFLNCSEMKDCSSCATHSQCGWSFVNCACFSNYIGNDAVYSSDKCPRVSLSSSPVIPQVGLQTVVISTAHFDWPSEFECHFENETVKVDFSVPASFVEGTIQCNYNNTEPYGVDTVLISVSVRFKGNKKVVATAEQKLEAQACSMYDTCKSCTDVAACSWVVDKSGSNYRAGCVPRSESSSSKSVECPTVVPKKLYADKNNTEPYFSVTVSGEELPQSEGDVVCFYGGRKGPKAKIDAEDGSVTYTCDLSSYRNLDSNVMLSLRVKQFDKTDETESIYFVDQIQAYFLDCLKHTDCEDCKAEHDKCGVVFHNDGSVTCTYKEDTDTIGDEMWYHACLGKYSTVQTVLNVEQDVLKLEEALCPTFYNDTYQCKLASGNTTIITADFVCNSNGEGATCSWNTSGSSVEGLVDVVLTIVKKQNNTRDDEGLENYTWNFQVAQCKSSSFDCMACTDSSFQTITDGLCKWSVGDSMCGIYGAKSNDNIEYSNMCPTLTLPSESVYIGETSFQVSVTNFRSDMNLSLRLVGAKKNYTCNVSEFNSKTLDVFCDELPEEETKDITAMLVTEDGKVFASSTNTMTVEKKPLELYIIILIAAVGALLVALLIVFIALVIHRHGGMRPFKFDVNRKPDFEAFRWATDLSNGKSHSQQNMQEWEQLRELLQNPIVCAAVNKATAATEADKYTSAMVYINASNGHATDFVMKLVDDEVQSVPNETQLFRGNSLASKAFRAYSRMVGLEYLWMTLARFIHELNHLVETSSAQNGNKSGVELESVSTTSTTTSTSSEGMSILSAELEVDPTKLSAGSDEESNSYMLSQRARQLLLCILNSTQYMPPELRYTAYSFAHAVHERFPGSERIAIGGTFFLRFICPALIAPHSYALLMTPDRKKPLVPNDRLQRQLVLLGKVLQNLANGVLFGKKEPFMIRMNQFITKNLDSVGKWMDEISSSNAGFRESATTVPQNTLIDSYQFVLGHITNNLRKIQANLEQAQAPPQLYASLEAHTQAEHR